LNASKASIVRFQKGPLHAGIYPKIQVKAYSTEKGSPSEIPPISSGFLSI
jgi:hypothetical protein